MPGYLCGVPLAERDGLPAADDGRPARPQAEAELGHAGAKAEGDEVAPAAGRLVLSGVQNKACKSALTDSQSTEYRQSRGALASGNVTERERDEIGHLPNLALITGREKSDL